MVIWEHQGNVHFPSVLKWPECFITVYYTALAPSFALKYRFYEYPQNNKTRFFYVLYSDKTWVFDQSERTQGPIYIINKILTINYPYFGEESSIY